MGSIVDSLLSGNINQEKPKKLVSIVDQLLSGATMPPGTKGVVADVGGQQQLGVMQTGQEPTGAISTITGKPITEPAGTQSPQQVGFGTMLETGIVDDPGTQMDILSKRMGIPRDRFGIAEGQIVYRGDDGILYPAMPGGRTPGGYKKLGANMVAHSPEIILGTTGAAAGPWGAALGAIGGAGIRKGLGAALYDEPQEIWGEGKLPDLDSNIGRMAVAGGTAALGEKYLGGGIIRGHDAVLGRKGAQLTKAAGRGRERINLPEVLEIEMLGKKHGIDLTTPQTTRSAELVSRFNMLGDYPETADRVFGIRKKQFDQINNAIGEYLDTIAPPTTTPGGAGRRAVEAATEAVGAPRKAATKASQKYYDEAKQIRGVDIGSTVEKVDALMDVAPRGSAERRSLQKIRNMITRQEKDASGNLIDVPEDRIASLDKIKKEINGMWEKDPKTAPDKEAQGSINAVLDDMLTSVDEQVPVYKQARDAYSSKMKDLGAEELQKTKLGQVAKLEGDKAEKAAHVLFSPSQSSPEAVAIAKEGIIREGGEDAWNELLRVHAQNALESVKETASGSGIHNIGGKWRKKLFGDPQQRKNLKAAMSKQQFENLDDFMKVLDRAGLILRKESETATRMISGERAKREAEIPFISAGLKTMAYPLRTPLKTAIDKFHEYLFIQRNKGLIELMDSPKAARQLKRMLQLKPESQTLIRQLGTFLSTSGAVPVKRDLELSIAPTSPPPMIQQR